MDSEHSLDSLNTLWTLSAWFLALSALLPFFFKPAWFLFVGLVRPDLVRFLCPSWSVVLRGNRRIGSGRIGASSPQHVFRSARGSAGARKADCGTRWLDPARPRWCPVQSCPEDLVLEDRTRRMSPFFLTRMSVSWVPLGQCQVPNKTPPIP